MKGFRTPILSLSADTANQTTIKIKNLGLLVKTLPDGPGWSQKDGEKEPENYMAGLYT